MLAGLIEFIKKREEVRINKEAGKPKPWTTDPILQHYRFCNVRREDDKVTIWIHHNWIRPNYGHPNLARAILLSRMINWPDTLEEIGFPYYWSKTHYADAIRERMMRHEKVWTGAYMITAESNGNPKEVSVCETVDQLDFDLPSTCLDTWKALQTLPRIGSFMAAQFVADAKHTHMLSYAPDRWEFCAPGPGSQKGLNIILGTPHKEWKQPEFQEEVNKIRDHLPFNLDAHNVQNCLCEYSKYVRGYSRSQYPGA
jgi:hypothetical protein